MTFPQFINIRFLDEELGVPLNEMLVDLIVHANEKNDYGIGPKFTDSDGLVSFSLLEIKKTIRQAQKEYPMDYKSDLDDCSSVVTIETRNQEQIQDLIETKSLYEKPWESDVGRFKQSRNVEYLSVSEKTDVLKISEGEVLEIKAKLSPSVTKGA